MSKFMSAVVVMAALAAVAIVACSTGIAAPAGPTVATGVVVHTQTAALKDADDWRWREEEEERERFPDLGYGRFHLSNGPIWGGPEDWRWRNPDWGGPSYRQWDFPIWPGTDWDNQWRMREREGEGGEGMFRGEGRGRLEGGEREGGERGEGGGRGGRH